MRPAINIASFGRAWSDPTAGILDTLKDYASEALSSGTKSAAQGATEGVALSITGVAEAAAAAHARELAAGAQPVITQASGTMKWIGIGALAVAGAAVFFLVMRGRK